MARRGKRIDDKLREEIRAYYASCGNMRETARKFGVSVSTVKKISEESDEFDQLRAQKIREYIEKAWDVIDRYIKRVADPELIQRTNARDSAVVIGTLWDKINKWEELKIKRQELALKEEENEIKRLELERKQQGPSDEDVVRVVQAFAKALGSDPTDVWEGIENERPPEEVEE
jgi:cytidylate kinase